MTVKSVVRSVCQSAAGSDSGLLPSSLLTDYWVYNSGLLTTGDVPAQEGNTITKWIGRKAGTVLTANGTIVARTVNGRLIPFLVSGTGNFSLPNGFASNSRDISFYAHVGRPGAAAEGGYCGFGSARTLELLNYQQSSVWTYDGTTIRTGSVAPRISPTVMAMRCSPIAHKVSSNSVVFSLSVMTSRTSTAGGRFNAIHDGTIQGYGRIYGYAVGPLISDPEHDKTVAWFNSIVPVPSDTSPSYNIVCIGDNNVVGTQSNGVSWATKIADNNPSMRVTGLAAAGAYFGVTANPLNKAANITQLQADYISALPGARNIIIITATNDLDQGVGSGALHFDRLKTFCQTRAAEGWAIAVCKLPNRPGFQAGAYNTEVTAFNNLLDADPIHDWKPDLATALNGVSGALNGDNINWSEAGQELAYQEIRSQIGF